MTTQITNKILVTRLIKDLGATGQAQIEVETGISRSSIRDILRGALPGAVTRKKFADFFKKDEAELFPFVSSADNAA